MNEKEYRERLGECMEKELLKYRCTFAEKCES